MQELILVPQVDATKLDSIYTRALQRSTELYILSAYLTHWAPSARLAAGCKTFKFIVGKDYGITRKQACESVLAWLPKRKGVQFKVAAGIIGFHPKAMFWKEKSGGMFALVGSSNLTDAAFRSNHEANSFHPLERTEFERIRAWIEQMEKRCVRVGAGWLKKYQESQLRGGHGSGGKPDPDPYVQSVQLPIPRDVESVLKKRREQMAVFKKNRSKLLGLFDRSASQRVSDGAFYEELPTYWGRDGARFQGAGFERTGRSAKFWQVSQAILKVWRAKPGERDAMVVAQRDWLAAKGNQARASYFTEMLCQLFPSEYPIVDRPVRRFLSAIAYRAPRGASEGEKYLALAEFLRFVLQVSPGHPARNLAELDAVVWAQYGR